jgi:PAS domain S-box-containing protein
VQALVNAGRALYRTPVTPTRDRRKKLGDKFGHLAFENSPVAMWLHDPATLALTAVNSRALACLGYSEKAFLALPPDDLVISLPGPGHPLEFLRAHLHRPGCIPVGIGSFRDAHGRAIPLFTLLSPVAGGEHEGLLVIAAEAQTAALAGVEPPFQVPAATDFIYPSAAAVCVTELPSDRILWMAASFAALWHQPEAALCAHPEAWLQQVLPADRELAMRYRKRAREGQEAHTEYRLIWPDQTSRWILERSFPVPGESGALDRSVRLVEDITERKKAEAALRGSEELHRAISDLTSDFAYSCRCDPDGSFEIDYITEGFTRISGYSMAEINEKGGWSEAIHPVDKAEVMAFAPRLAQGYSDEREIRILTKDGATRWVRYSAIPIWSTSQKRVVRLYGATQDITDRKRREQELGELAGRLRELSRRLLEAQEAERRRIARELHDEVGQSLTALKINIQSISNKSTHPDVRSRLDECENILTQLLKQVRDLSLDLRPSLLDDLGLSAVLRWYVDRQAQRSGLRVRLQLDELADRLPAAVETACFRVAQEALTNVVRHAQAKTISVKLQLKGVGLHLMVGDDGVGFDVPLALQRAASGASLGLLGMQERMELVGGTLKLESSPKSGTRVHAVFPV